MLYYSHIRCCLWITLLVLELSQTCYMELIYPKYSTTHFGSSSWLTQYLWAWRPHASRHLREIKIKWGGPPGTGHISLREEESFDNNIATNVIVHLARMMAVFSSIIELSQGNYLFLWNPNILEPMLNFRTVVQPLQGK